MSEGPAATHRATAALVAAAAVNAGALLSPDTGGGSLLGLPGEDKVVHVALFVLLAVTTWWRVGVTRTGIVVLVGYAALTEAVQSWWLAGRGGDVGDLAADVVGIALGWVAARSWRPASLGSVPGRLRRDQVIR